ncbi:MAG: 16S rRNA (uracil(1498)-N(3))-methyltransferase, partial [Planctomycetaceae bacterium]|nr:16S rRNA (uracil(1498)-N(3))-methyltransferase [Planctomycetaceae bacterium]
MPHRAFCDSLATDRSGVLTLGESESHHVLNVLRMKPGARLEVFDGRGNLADAVILSTTRRSVTLEAEGLRSCPPRTNRRLCVTVSPPKGDRLKWMLEKLTEVGVDAITLLKTDRTVVTPAETRIDKLRSTMIAAAKQSQQLFLPRLNSLVTLDEAIHKSDHFDLPGKEPPGFWIAHPDVLNQNPPASRQPDAEPLDQVLLIGPEGGFTDAE